MPYPVRVVQRVDGSLKSRMLKVNSADVQTKACPPISRAINEWACVCASQAVDVSVGYKSTAAITPEGQLLVWGRGEYNHEQLYVLALHPAAVSSTVGCAEISTNRHVCILNICMYAPALCISGTGMRLGLGGGDSDRVDSPTVMAVHTRYSTVPNHKAIRCYKGDLHISLASLVLNATSPCPH